MQTIKYIMLFLLFISSTILGKILSQKYVDRVKELEDIKNLFAQNMYQIDMDILNKKAIDVVKDNLKK